MSVAQATFQRVNRHFYSSGQVGLKLKVSSCTANSCGGPFCALIAHRLYTTIAMFKKYLRNEQTWNVVFVPDSLPQGWLSIHAYLIIYEESSQEALPT